jgi:sugar phosphate isomerase/epimerase
MYPSMWTGLYNHLSPEDAVQRLALQGWGGVELSTEHLAAIRQGPSPESRAVALGRKARDLGVRLEQAHVLLEADIAAPDPSQRDADMAAIGFEIRLLAAAGVRVGVLHPGVSAQVAYADSARPMRDTRMASLRELADQAGSVGVRLALENGGRVTGPDGETLEDGSVAGLRAVINELGLPALGLCLDTGHAILEGWQVPEAVAAADGLLIAVHVADNDGSGDQHRIPYSPGSPVDWRQVVAALRRVRYQGPFNLEIPGERQRPPQFLDLVARYALQVTWELLAPTEPRSQPTPGEGSA